MTMRKNDFLSWLMFFSFLLSAINIQAQEIKVSGKVTDTKGEPIPGVEIIIVGTKKGAISDFDGIYSINANKGDKLKASAVGMKSQVKTVTGSKLDFVLQDDALGLDEVVVTAQSGIVTKKQLGSVIHSVKAEDLGQRNVANIAEALQGSLPGAQIMRNNGSVAPSISIRLRGPSTVLGNSSPLIMIDGVIINNQTRTTPGSGGSSDALSDIDMNDIDHIEIVKGPAASAMYGSMASNGIIQIFTKKGKTGEPTVTVTSEYNVSKIRKIKPYNTALYKWEKVSGVYVRTPIDKRYDYQSYIFNTAPGMYNGVKISGGTDYTKYSIGGSFLDNNGIIRNSNYKRSNIDLKLNQKLSDFIKLDLGVIYSHNNTKEIPFGSGSNYKYAPLQSILFADNATNPVNPDGTYANMGWQGNPYESIDKIDSENKVNRVITNFGIRTKPLKGLNIDYIFGYDYTAQDGKFYVPFGFGADADGKLSLSNNRFGVLSSHIKANYNYDITDNIKASTGAGYQYLYERRDYQNAGKPTLSIFPNLEIMDGANDIETYSSIYEYSIWGSWIQQHFNFYDIFHLTLGGRWDKASTFGDNVQAFYPKVSGSLVLSDMDFWQQSIGKYINSFKLRGAWGEAGNMSVLTSPSYISIKDGTLYSPDSYLGMTTYVPSSTNGNNGIRPEVTRENEFGFDASFLEGRFGLEFTMYHQDVKDLILKREMSPSSGFSTRVDNVGTLTNDGIEVSLMGNPIKKKNFDWNFSINYSKNKNVVNNIDGGWIKFGGYGTSIAANGYPLGVFYGYFYATDENGNWVLDANGNPQRARGIQIDNDGDGFPESYEQTFDGSGQPTGDLLKKVIGDPNPDYILSFSNTFRYKNISFSFALEAVQGYDIMSWDKRMGYSFRTSPNPGSGTLFTGWEYAGWELENDRRGWYGNRFRIYESFVEDASFVKLRNVALSYNWKKPIKGIKSAKFTLSGSNLISWDSYWGYDPEVNSWGAANVTRAQDYANIPIPKVYSFRVQLKF